MEENIFADKAPEVSATESTNVAPEAKPVFNIPTEVSALVGDGKKYKSVEDALKALPHSQAHIQKLEDENKQFREELLRRKTAEDLLTEIKQSSFSQQATPASVEADPIVLSQIVEQVLEQKTAKQQAQNNTASVANKFTELYGDKAQSVYNSIAAKNGLSVATLNALSAKSPSAVLTLAGIDSKDNRTTGKLQSDVRIPVSTTNNQQSLSAKMPKYPTTKDVMNSFQAAREKVNSKYSKG